VDLLKLVVRISVSSSHLIVRQYALSFLKDLLAVNFLNAAILHQTAVLEDLVAVLAIAARSTATDLLPSLGLTVDDPQDFSPEKKKDLKGKGKLKDESPTTQATFVEAEKEREREKTEISSEDDRVTALQAYIKTIMEILNYVAVVLCHHNTNILQEYTNLLVDIPLPSENTIVTAVMASIVKILSVRRLPLRNFCIFFADPLSFFFFFFFLGLPLQEGHH